MYEVIKNVKIPEPKGGRSETYPFAKLEVGDGFNAPRDMGKYKNGADRRQVSISNSAYSFTKRTRGCKDWEFITRIIDDNTVRCARVR